MLRFGSEYYLHCSKRQSCSILKRRGSSYCGSSILTSTTSPPYKNFKRSFRQICFPNTPTYPSSNFIPHQNRNILQSTFGNQSTNSVLPRNSVTTHLYHRIYTTTTIVSKDTVQNVSRTLRNSGSNSTGGSKYFVPFTIAFTSVLIGIPLIALGQGTYLLYEYRTHHGSAPRPIMPSRGLVVVTTNDSDEDVNYYESPSSATASRKSLKMQGRNDAKISGYVSYRNNKSSNTNTKQAQREKPPLRLLVIGDSLAAGVGISESSTPVLPESIALELSKAMNGRPVYWVCTGVPGYTASEIVEEIYQLDNADKNESSDEDDDTNQLNLFDRLKEWQAEMRQNAQNRLELSRRKAREWLEEKTQQQQKSGDSQDSNQDNDVSAPMNIKIQRWLKNVRQQTVREIGKLRDIIVPSIDENDDDNEDDNDKQQHEDAKKIRRLTKRRLTLDPNVVGKYDIAVVLTGLNDLKESALPFMFNNKDKSHHHHHPDNCSCKSPPTTLARKKTDDDDDEECDDNGGLKVELLHILYALQNKMKESVTPIFSASTNQSNHVTEPASTTAQQQSNTDGSNYSDFWDDNNPIVVFPALPVAPTSISHMAPLSWFLRPLLEDVDAHKKALAEMYPGLVLFVDSPSEQDMSNAEKTYIQTTERSEASADNRIPNERVHLKLTDVTQQAKERILEAMKQHYGAWRAHQGLDEDDDKVEVTGGGGGAIRRTSRGPKPKDDEKHESYELDYFGDNKNTMKQPDVVGSTMIAADGIHPNDDGYDMWGRHIATAIVNEIKRRRPS